MDPNVEIPTLLLFKRSNGGNPFEAPNMTNHVDIEHRRLDVLVKGMVAYVRDC